MTYCVGLLVDGGIALLSDTRTNAGVDNISIYRKMFTYQVPGERVIAIMTAGNLSVTQTLIARLEEPAVDPEGGDESHPILKVPSMLRAAELVGQVLSEVSSEISAKLSNGVSAGASIIMAGQRKGGPMRMFLIYPQGNFIEATPDTPYLQIGEHKYGKPILDRVITTETPLDEAVKAMLLSMDSTLRSNLSVGMPLDLVVIEKDALRIREARRIEPEDEEFSRMSTAWSAALRKAFADI